VSTETRDISTNPEILAIDQDPRCLQGVKFAEDTRGLQVYGKVLAGAGKRAVLLFNRTGSAANMTVRWADLGLTTASANHLRSRERRWCCRARALGQGREHRVLRGGLRQHRPPTSSPPCPGRPRHGRRGTHRFRCPPLCGHREEHQGQRHPGRDLGLHRGHEPEVDPQPTLVTKA
jgi:hypothetical protein